MQVDSTALSLTIEDLERLSNESKYRMLSNWLSRSPLTLHYSSNEVSQLINQFMR